MTKIHLHKILFQIHLRGKGMLPSLRAFCCGWTTTPRSTKFKAGLVFLHDNTDRIWWRHIPHFMSEGCWLLSPLSQFLKPVLVPTGQHSCIKGLTLPCSYVNLRPYFQCSCSLSVLDIDLRIKKHPLSFLHAATFSLFHALEKSGDWTVTAS